MKITWFGHSCFRLETGDSVLFIDPFLKGNPTFEQSGIAWDEATVLPCYYGTFPGMLDPSADEFVTEMKGHNVVVPKVGQTLTV